LLLLPQEKTRIEIMKKKAAQQAKIPAPASWLTGRRALFILFAISFLVYLPTLLFGFSPLDERWLIVAHQDTLRSFGNMPDLFKSPILGMYYRPLCMFSFMIDTVAGQGSKLVFHLSNILLHSLCTVLLFRFLKRLKISDEFAFFAALVFAVHPINVHTVAWIPGRNDSLLCLFSVLSCSQLSAWIDSGKIRHFIFHLIAFLGALFTKENAIVLPFVYALLWYFFANEKKRNSAVLISASWLSMAVLWFVLRNGIINRLPPVTSAMNGNNLLHFLEALLVYAGKTIVPADQAIMPVLKDMSMLPFIAVTVLLIAVSFKTGLRDKKIAFFGIAWFFIFLLIPAWSGTTSSNGEQYEHRLYTSLIGAFIFFSQLKININSATLKRVTVILAIVFSVKTIVRSQAYKDDWSFLEAGTAESPSIAFFQNNLGFLYEQKGEYSTALEYYNEAIRLRPDRAEYYNNRGNLFFEMKDYRRAFEDDNKSLQMKPDQPTIYVNRSMANYFLGDHKAAQDDLAQGEKGKVPISKDYLETLYNALQLDTVKMCTEALKNDSNDLHALNHRGICNIRLGLYQQAVNDFDHALRIVPGSKVFQYNRNMALANLEAWKKQH
jgi:tetratricopeptide (TPR) repeat protein